jgi:hypothetical protein
MKKLTIVGPNNVNHHLGQADPASTLRAVAHSSGGGHHVGKTVQNLYLKC